MVTITVNPREADQRLDRYIRKIFRSVPLSVIYKWIRKRKIKVNGTFVQQHYRLRAGDNLVLYIPDKDRRLLQKIPDEPHPSGKLPSIIFEDQALLVLDKPSGLAVHGGTRISSDHLTARVRSYLKAAITVKTLSYDPAPVHRLDRETSGLVVYAKDLISHRTLCQDLKQHRWQKHYLCLVFGQLPANQGVFTWSLDSKIKNSTVTQLHAETQYSTIRLKEQVLLLDVVPVTGRFRQIRRHLALAGLALYGETRYGRQQWCQQQKQQNNWLFLHAHRLELFHPLTQDKLVFNAPLPVNLRIILRQVGLPWPGEPKRERNHE